MQVHELQKQLEACESTIQQQRQALVHHQENERHTQDNQVTDISDAFPHDHLDLFSTRPLSFPNWQLRLDKEGSCLFQVLQSAIFLID